VPKTVRPHVLLCTEIPYNHGVRIVIETPTFQKQAEKLWTEDERLAFIDWIAANPLAGDVIPGADAHAKFAGAALDRVSLAVRE
jgi:hypothetical protein